MRIASWNVNSIRARFEHLRELCKHRSPDVVCLQETKVEDDKFPVDDVADLGYRALLFGQKTYNGMATLTRFGLTADDVKYNLDGDDRSASRRALACTVEGIRIVNVYVPNGQAVGTPAFAQKLAWMERLIAELEAHASPAQDLFLCGDFNVAPEPIDVWDPARWDGRVLFHPEERRRLRRIIDWGLVDVVRAEHLGERGLYSWWDYRAGSFRKNLGLRIDLALLTRPLANCVASATIDRDFRKLERPSDHAPIIVDLR